MQGQKIKQVKKGEYIKLRNSESAPVWIRGEYCKTEKKYELTCFDDINKTIYRKGDSFVFIGFTF